MQTTPDANNFQAELRRLDALLQESARIADPAAQAHVRALVQAVLGLYAAGLERILAHLDAADGPAHSTSSSRKSARPPVIRAS